MKETSLTPLIIVFAIIILLTIIVLNSNIDSKKKTSSNDDSHPELTIRQMKKKISKPRPLLTKDIHFNYDVNFAKAKKLISAKQESEAEDVLRTILVFKPEDLNTLSLLGGLFFYSGRYKEAEDIFKQQIKIDPNSHLAYNRLASTLAKQNKFNDAIKTDSKALAINPNSPEVNINLAGMYSITGKKERALKHLEKAYESLGYAILPLTIDSSFNNIRSTPKFQSLIAKAKQELPSVEPTSKTKIDQKKQ